MKGGRWGRDDGAAEGGEGTLESGRVWWWDGVMGQGSAGNGMIIAILSLACFNQHQSTSINNSQQQSTHSQQTVNTTVNKHVLIVKTQ